MYVDEAIKVANRNTASETVRTLLVYGYVLDPPTGDVEAAEVAVSRHPTHRTYRAENTYGVSSGKWWEILPESGWSQLSSMPGTTRWRSCPLVPVPSAGL